MLYDPKRTKQCSKCKKRFKHVRFNKNGKHASSYCKGCAKIYSQNYWKNVRAPKISYNYGITEEQYKLLLRLQRKVCAICKCPDKRRLGIDHDHITGQVRGLLCTRCNLMLGLSKDSIDLLQTSVEYLKRGVNGKSKAA